MKILFGILAICILAFIGSRWSFAHFRMPRFAIQVFFTGAEFILVGLILGPFVLNVIDAATWDALHPIRALCLGWIGFVFGLHLESAVIRRFPREFLPIALYMPLAVTLLVFIPMSLAVHEVFKPSGIASWTAVLVLSFTAAHTGPSSLAIFQKTHTLKRSQMLNLFRFVAGLDAYPGVIATGIAGALLSTDLPFGSLIHPALAWFLITTATGLLMGAVLILLMETRPGMRKSLCILPVSSSFLEVSVFISTSPACIWPPSPEPSPPIIVPAPGSTCWQRYRNGPSTSFF